MRDAYIPDIPVEVVGQSINIGEPYLVYELRFFCDAITGETRLYQIINVCYMEMPCLLLAGVCFSSGNDICFLHPETIGELIRINKLNVDQYIRQRLIQQQLLDDEPKDAIKMPINFIHTPTGRTFYDVDQLHEYIGDELEDIDQEAAEKSLEDIIAFLKAVEVREVEEEEEEEEEEETEDTATA